MKPSILLFAVCAVVAIACCAPAKADHFPLVGAARNAARNVARVGLNTAASAAGRLVNGVKQRREARQSRRESRNGFVYRLTHN